MVKILAGSYANEIYTLEFDPSAGSLSLSSSITVGFHPSWITPHPSTGGETVIVTGLEQSAGEIVVVSFDKDGKGTIEASGISSHGADPCTVIATKDEVIVGNVSFAVLKHSIRVAHFLPISILPAQ